MSTLLWEMLRYSRGTTSSGWAALHLCPGCSPSQKPHLLITQEWQWQAFNYTDSGDSNDPWAFDKNVRLFCYCCFHYTLSDHVCCPKYVIHKCQGHLSSTEDSKLPRSTFPQSCNRTVTPPPTSHNHQRPVCSRKSLEHLRPPSTWPGPSLFNYGFLQLYSSNTTICQALFDIRNIKTFKHQVLSLKTH